MQFVQFVLLENRKVDILHIEKTELNIFIELRNLNCWMNLIKNCNVTIFILFEPDELEASFQLRNIS